MDKSAVPSGILDTNRLSVINKALSDSTRIKILRMLAQGREACCSVPPSVDAPEGGICICEFVKETGLIQSLVSYHMKVLKEAGLVREQVRGKWNYYSLNRALVREYLGAMSELLL
ncbi:MAG: ArsR family transcriptional regulator [Firmicutes bacterium]|nr:ArsR family transcriptional regulator [Bacillota bacterium]